MAEREPKQLGPGLITVDQAAKLILMTPDRVRQLAKEGWIDKPARGAYLLVSVVQGYIRFLREDARRSSKSAADSRLKDAKLEEIALRVAEKKRELVPIEDALAVVDFVVGKVRSEFSGLPASVTRDLDLRDKIDERLNEVLTRLADAAREAGDAARSGRDPGSPVAEDDAG